MILKTLLSYPNIDVNAQDEMGRTPLHRIVEGKPMDGVDTMLGAKGLDFNAQDVNGETPIHVAAKCNYPEYITYLLAHNVDLTIVDNNGQTALHKAATSTNFDSIKFLLGKGIDVNAQDVHGLTALHLATKAKESVGVQYILKEANIDTNLPDENKQTPLHWAAKNGNYNIIKAIISSGGNPNVKDKSGVHNFIFIKCQSIYYPKRINLGTKSCSVQGHLFQEAKNKSLYSPILIFLIFIFI